MDKPIPATVDVLVVGGGINGAGIARDAAGRGLSVLLCEQHDLAAHTSSASTKLIHGGLRYLEHLEIDLVRKALKEREILMRAAPHIIRPIRLVMPHDRHQRPAWLIRSGLFLYDHLARRELLPASSSLDLRRHPAGGALQADYRRGFMYSDARVDDARLVIVNAIDAAERGAHILTRCKLEAASREGIYWRANLRRDDGVLVQVQAQVLVNATGAWAASVLNELRGGIGHGLRLVKGSHIIVPRLYDHEYAYLLQHTDGRVVFVIPYEDHYTLIGTTDVDYTGDPATPRIDQDEITYLCEVVNRFFRRTMRPEEIVHTYSGVRALPDEPTQAASQLSRDYRLLCDRAGPLLLSIFGGKITTYRRLAEEAVDLLANVLNRTSSGWTSTACLPGGDLSGNLPSAHSTLEFDTHIATLHEQYHWLPRELLSRYVHTYGSRLHHVLQSCVDRESLGQEVLPGLYDVEIRYLVQTEWARTAEDILWRRTKLGLSLTPQDAEVLDAWLHRQSFFSDSESTHTETAP